MQQYWQFKTVAAFLLGVSILAGAFGAHALKGTLTAAELATWQTASNYLMIQSIGILVVSFLPKSPKVKLSLVSLTAGTILFSGSLFSLITFNLKILGMLTPVGGLAMMFGWFVLAWHCFRQYETLKT